MKLRRGQQNARAAASGRRISRAEAERLVLAYQKRLLNEYHRISTWELYALHGVGHCCAGPYVRSDVELRGLYADCIPGIRELSDERLVRAVTGFELSRSPDHDFVTCRPGRLCDGLRRYTDDQLVRLFSDALEGCRIVGGAPAVELDGSDPRE